MKPLDSIDIQLLDALRENARISLATLGARVHLSRNAVRQRIERLEREGRISGYTIVEPAPPSEQRVGAYLFIDRVDRLRGSEVIAFLRQIEEIVFCDVVSGELDLIARVEAPNAERVQEIWQDIARHPGVRDTTTALVLSTELHRP